MENEGAECPLDFNEPSLADLPHKMERNSSFHRISRLFGKNGCRSLICPQSDLYSWGLPKRAKTAGSPWDFAAWRMPMDVFNGIALMLEEGIAWPAMCRRYFEAVSSPTNAGGGVSVGDASYRSPFLADPRFVWRTVSQRASFLYGRPVSACRDVARNHWHPPHADWGHDRGEVATVFL